MVIKFLRVENGARIAQMVVSPIEQVELEEVDNLDPTEIEAKVALVQQALSSC